MNKVHLDYHLNKSLISKNQLPINYNNSNTIIEF